MQTVRAQERAKQHPIAIVIHAGAVAVISETSSDAVLRRLYEPFFEELRRLGDVEGQNLAIERYSGEGRPECFADLARQVANRNPDVIVAITNGVALAVRAAPVQYPSFGSELRGSGLDSRRAWHARAATSPASTSMTTRSGESVSRSSRKPSLRHPKSRFCCPVRHGKVSTANCFGN
jgi:hypothetical protein